MALEEQAEKAIIHGGPPPTTRQDLSTDEKTPDHSTSKLTGIVPPERRWRDSRLAIGRLSAYATQEKHKLRWGIMSDRTLRSKAEFGEMKPEYRLPPLIPAAFIIPAGLLLYGRTAEKHVHWVVPIIGTSFLGLGVMPIFMAVQTYLIDAYTMHAASAMAANTVLRSLMGALIPIAGPSIHKTLGGWGNSVLAFVAIALIPVPFLFIRYGDWIRKHPELQIEL